jgi:predicted Zn-dependent protease
MALHAAGKREEAKLALRKVIAINPQDWQGWLALAELEWETGDGNEARRLLYEAISSRVESVSVLTRLAEFEAATGNTDAAHSLRRRADALASEHGLQVDSSR